MAATSGVRVTVAGRGAASVATGVPVLDHLLTLLAEHGGFDLSLEVAPGAAESEAASAGNALGRALADALRGDDARGIGSAVVPADEALAHVALEASGRPLPASKDGLTGARVGGRGTDIVARFLEALADGAGLRLHVRLLEGRDTSHVLAAIFTAPGVALAQASRP